MISILMPIYNGERFVEKSIDSVLNQSFTNFELLIGFNGTVDKSKEIVSKYNDHRIRVFDYGDEKGKSKTLNRLINEAKYEWVAIQDDDDVWVEDKLEKQILYTNDFDVIGTLIDYIDENDKRIGTPNLSSNPIEIIHLSILGNNQVANSSTIFRKKMVFDIGGWDEKLDLLAEKGIQPCEDYDMWLKFIRLGKKFINVPEELVHHRRHVNSNFNNLSHNFFIK